MTLKEELKKARQVFKDSRMGFIRKELLKQVRHGNTEVSFPKEYWDDDIIQQLKEQGIKCSIENDPKGFDKDILTIYGLE